MNPLCSCVCLEWSESAFVEIFFQLHSRPEIETNEAEFPFPLVLTLSVAVVGAPTHVSCVIG